jgi:hypothetical protein
MAIAMVLVRTAGLATTRASRLPVPAPTYAS